MKINIRKYYESYSLFACDQELQGRAVKIESLDVGVRFFKCGDVWVRESQRIRGAKGHPRRGELSKVQALQLADQLERAHQAGVIHGDVNVKNIIINQKGDLHLIDWELDLKQISQGRWALMATHPWVHRDDDKMNKLSIKTDLLCYYSMINKVDKSEIHDAAVYAIIDQCLNSDQPFFEILKYQKGDGNVN